MSTVHNHSHSCCPPHSHHQNKSTSEKLFYLLEKVSAIALGIFAAYACFELFLPFFLLGAAVGLYQYYSGEHAHAEKGRSSCSQGFLEQVTGVKLPPLLSLGANLAVTWCHIDHHTTIFAPIVGLSLGAWAGQTMADLASKVSPVKREQHAHA